MPKIHKTKKQRKQKLHSMLQPTHLFQQTSIFTNPIGAPPLDKYTVEHIKHQFDLWFNSWIAEDLKEFLLDNK